MIVYPNPDSWDEFYPSEIFIAVSASDPRDIYLPILKKANIGATIALGEGMTRTTTYKKVGDIEALVDMDTSLVLLSTAEISQPNGG